MTFKIINRKLNILKKYNRIRILFKNNKKDLIFVKDKNINLYYYEKI